MKTPQEIARDILEPSYASESALAKVIACAIEEERINAMIHFAKEALSDKKRIAELETALQQEKEWCMKWAGKCAEYQDEAQRFGGTHEQLATRLLKANGRITDLEYNISEINTRIAKLDPYGRGVIEKSDAF